MEWHPVKESKTNNRYREWSYQIPKVFGTQKEHYGVERYIETISQNECPTKADHVVNLHTWRQQCGVQQGQQSVVTPNHIKLLTRGFIQEDGYENTEDGNSRSVYQTFGNE